MKRWIILGVFLFSASMFAEHGGTLDEETQSQEPAVETEDPTAAPAPFPKRPRPQPKPPGWPMASPPPVVK